jgi:hypothetical protein
MQLLVPPLELPLLQLGESRSFLHGLLIITSDSAYEVECFACERAPRAGSAAAAHVAVAFRA